MEVTTFNIEIMQKIVASFIVFTLMFAIESTKVNAQSFFESDTSVSLKADSRIDGLLERYNRIHKIRGYRIQIISSSKKDKTKKTRSKFAAQFPKFTTHESYQQPFFTIKVGDFLTKLEAEKNHRLIKEQFPDSFIVPDFVEPIAQYSKRD